MYKKTGRKMDSDGLRIICVLEGGECPTCHEFKKGGPIYSILWED